MIKIAITGTIGSGKSLCCDIIRKIGYEVFDCDHVVKQILNDKNIQDEISNLLNINFENGVDYKRISDIVFKDDVLLMKYESIIYKKLVILLLDAIKSSNSDIFFAEVPLLFEKKFDVFFDQYWLITSDRKVIVERLLFERGLDLSEVNRRLKLQMSQDEKIKRATVVIENNKDEQYLYTEICDKIENIKRR